MGGTGLRTLREQLDEIVKTEGLLKKEMARRLHTSASVLAQMQQPGRTSAKFIEKLARVLNREPWEFDAYLPLKAEEVCREDTVVLEMVRRWLKSGRKGG